VTDAEVLQEILHRYVALNRPDAIQPAFDALLGVVDDVLPVDRRAVEAAKTLVLERQLSAGDGIHLAVMAQHGIRRILSFDRGFDAARSVTLSLMKWRDMRPSGNVEDRRGYSPRMSGAGGMRMGGLGLGGLLVLLVLGWMLGVDPLTLLDPGAMDPGAGTGGGAPAAGARPTDEGGEFATRVLGDTEDTWAPIFAREGRSYAQPILVLFTGQVDSACGFSSAAVGPFYCPRDRKVYIDLSFYRDLERRFGAPGDFAQAYVLAHEVGHHVQNLTGALNSRGDSVATELQADCFAGVWGYSAARRGLLEAGDVEEGLAAAAAIGDDRLQQQSQGRVVPESFTHGSSAQRVAAFRRGLEGGDPAACR
jgi:predicted metalloprotease